MSKYLVKLKPLNTFFIGTESKYKRKYNGNNKNVTEADYFQRSAYFPQQTTLLGTLRYYILQENNQIPINSTEIAKELIGEKGFDVNEKEPDFKAIRDISPVFMVDSNNKFYFQNPLNLVLRNNKAEYLKHKEAGFKSNLSNNKIFLFTDYDEKKGLNSFLLNSEQDILLFDYNAEKEKKGELNGIFIENEKIGITKGKNGQTNDKGFYKQIAYSLKKGYSFGFIANIDSDKLKNHSGFVSMGAEKSLFSISFVEWDKNIKDELSLEKNTAHKIVLLSDTYISDGALNKNDFIFSISDTVTFRFLETKITTKKGYYSSDPLKKNDSNMKRSGKYNLFKKGSVFFFRDENQLNTFTTKINNETVFCKIGYNHYKTI